jgi:hypothetical protein
MARERDRARRDARRLGQEEGHLLAAATPLARAHADAREALELVLVEGPIGPERPEVPRRHPG